MNREVILYIGMSVDGYIAKEDGNIDFLSIVDAPNEDYGYYSFLHDIDTVIWGRKTYDKLLSFGIDFPHKDKKVYVLSRTKTGSDDNVTFFGGDIRDLISSLKGESGKNIYCDGGGELVFELLKYKLINKMVISVIPHLVGNGIRLFKDNRPEQHLRFIRSVSFPSGLVQLWYENK